METLHFILACYGMTFILVYGKIFEDLRPEKDYTKKWNTFFTRVGYARAASQLASQGYYEEARALMTEKDKLK